MRTLILAAFLALSVPMSAYNIDAQNVCKPKEYALVCEENLVELNHSIAHYLASGWYIYGNPTFGVAQSFGATYCQAVVRF